MLYTSHDLLLLSRPLDFSLRKARIVSLLLRVISPLNCHAKTPCVILFCKKLGKLIADGKCCLLMNINDFFFFILFFLKLFIFREREFDTKDFLWLFWIYFEIYFNYFICAPKQRDWIFIKNFMWRFKIKLLSIYLTHFITVYIVTCMHACCHTRLPHFQCHDFCIASAN